MVGFSYRMVPEVYQVFWAGMAAGEFINDAAIAADSGNVDARIELGEMFLEKYNGPDARQMFAGVLRENPSQPRALLGMARVLDFDGLIEVGLDFA